MKMIWQDSTREKLHKRLTRLQFDTAQLWVGKMSARAWGVFAYHHFDYHLRQFGA